MQINTTEFKPLLLTVRIRKGTDTLLMGLKVIANTEKVYSTYLDKVIQNKNFITKTSFSAN